MESCVIYARFSSHGQNEQSIEAQIRICKEFAESKGYHCINIYSDRARTGTNDARPAFQRMIQDANSGAFQYIIVYMFDRFARNRRDSIMYKEMLKEKYGIRVLSALEPIAEDEGGEFYEMFLDWNAEKYSKRLSKRVRDGLDTSVANGTFCGGYLIYGYKLDLEPIAGKPGKFIKRVIIDEEEAEILRFVFQQYANGITKKEIAKMLNEKGLRCKGKLFQGRTFDKYLINQKYTGEFTFGGRPCTNMYPQIISKELFQKVQERLNKNRYFINGVVTAKEQYLLTGKLFCGNCGREMTADGGTSKQGNQFHYYTCKGRRKKVCQKRREHKGSIEKFVADYVLEFLSNPQNASIVVDDVIAYYNTRTDKSNLKAIQTKIANAKKEIDELADSFVKARNNLLRDTIERKMQEYEILLNDLSLQEAMLELEIGNQTTREDLLDFISNFIKSDTTDKDVQRKIIDNLVSQIFVSDEDTTILLYITPGKTIGTVSFESVKDALLKAKSVQTLTPPSRQK